MLRLNPSCRAAQGKEAGQGSWAQVMEVPAGDDGSQGFDCSHLKATGSLQTQQGEGGSIEAKVKHLLSLMMMDGDDGGGGVPVNTLVFMCGINW